MSRPFFKSLQGLPGVNAQAFVLGVLADPTVFIFCAGYLIEVLIGQAAIVMDAIRFFAFFQKDI